MSRDPRETGTRKLPTVHEFFAPGGILANSALPFEHRPGQIEMAKSVEQALTERRHLIVEAGTGTGKTLAYLLPALRTGQRVIFAAGLVGTIAECRPYTFMIEIANGVRIEVARGAVSRVLKDGEAAAIESQA